MKKSRKHIYIITSSSLLLLILCALLCSCSTQTTLTTTTTTTTKKTDPENEDCAHEFVLSKREEPTCTFDGYESYVCSLCGETKTDVLSAVGHTEEIIPSKKPTCSEEGLSEGVRCSVCGEVIREQSHIKTLPHTMDLYEHKGEEGHAPKCSVCGFVDESKTSSHRFYEDRCITCGYIDTHEDSRMCFHQFQSGKEYTVDFFSGGYDPRAVVPTEYNGIPVTCVVFGGSKVQEVVIPEGVKMVKCAECHNLVSINIPSSTKTITYDTFANDWSLKNVELSEGLEEIGEYTFMDCTSLEKIVIPKSVKKIGKGAFEGCRSLREIVLPEGIQTIEEEAFRGCESLKSITFPSSVKKIGNSVLSLCGSLDYIYVSDGNKNYRSIGNCLVDLKQRSIIAGCTNSVIPTDINIANKIADNAFRAGNIKEIVIPSNIIVIGNYAFKDQFHLSSLTIEKGVAVIGKGAFCNCRAFDTLVYTGNASDWARIVLPSKEDNQTMPWYDPTNIRIVGGDGTVIVPRYCDE